MAELLIDFKKGKVGWALPPLTDEQKDIVFSKDDNICVIANAATGKTRVIHAFCLRLLNDGINPEDILVITYTVTGKEVMAKRLEGTGIKVYTIHGHGMGHSKQGRKEFLDAIKYPLQDEEDPFQSLLRMRAKGEKYYLWVICDEGQDLTPTEYECFKSWGKHLFLVGDPYQSIFQYANAQPSLLKEFAHFYCNDKVYPLSINQRSARRIVEVAKKFSGKNMKPRENAPEGLVKIGWEIPPNLDNITILMRTRKEVEDQVKALRKRGIPNTWIKTNTGTERNCLNWKDGKEWKVTSRYDFLPTIVCTFHAFKGDESDRVWCVYRRPTWEVNENEEECIFYVGLTRAREELYIEPEYMPFIRRLG